LKALSCNNSRSIAPKYLFSAKGAAVILSLWQRPRKSYHNEPSALEACFDNCGMEYEGVP